MQIESSFIERCVLSRKWSVQSLFDCTESLFAEKESIRLTAGTGEFTRVSGACNGEFGGAAVVRVAHFASEIALSGAIILTLLLVCSFSPRVHSIPRGPQ